MTADASAVGKGVVMEKKIVSTDPYTMPAEN